MKISTDKNNFEKKQTLILFVSSLIAGLIATIFGHALAAVSAGLMATLWYTEQKEKRVFSYILPIAVLASDFIINGFDTLVGVFTVVLALLIFLSFKFEISKCESVFAMTLFSAAMILLMYVILGMQNEEGLSVMEFYQQIFEQYKQDFIDTFNEMYSSYSDLESTGLVTEEYISSVFDSILNLVVSFVVIYGFALAGIACKVFSFSMSRFSKDNEKIKKWKFNTPVVYAYFYLTLVILSLFVSSQTTVFALAVLNLKSVFMIIYAYVGFSFLLKLLSAKMRPIVAAIVLLFVTLIFINFFVSTLSFFGIFYTIMLNRSSKIKPGDSDGRAE